MRKKGTKIVLDADVVIHFAKGVRAKGSKIPNIRIEQYVCEHFI